MNGEKRPVLNYDLSVQVAEVIQAQKNRCWRNASTALLRLPGLFLFASYTEGWIVVPEEQEIQVIEHGWIEDMHGSIVDPSIVLFLPKGQVLAYFAGLRFSWFQMQEIPQSWPLPLAHLTSRSTDGWDHPAYKAAYDAALAYAECLAHQQDKSVQIYQGEHTMLLVDEEGSVIVAFKK